ncbi:GNAT family N-acetyltransferase [Glycomyces sp. TRM65418]|uniref:GNAT family N-acetyltransferase n=1 Tax=Glycomyces sp. TRM65418 TaxID=2867006 RepID=UPI001CE575D5|nr:GNAT family N-acetyltransferase [Glycomyces sp. TRM65418]MCC3763997.1 GNAT family N-acetyltransferase [Glycomyces sp. TRM65418]QZD53693.1 GNAT family N-acetyltransferase [Glycomyces sp. TRM65418]
MELRELHHGNLPDLLEAAVAGTDPLEVMPPVDGPPGWNDERRQAFHDFHRARSLDAPEPVETTYVVEVDGRVVGAARLEPQSEGVEVGLWLARGHRGLGIGGEVLEALAVVARSQGHTRLLASTTTENTAARRILDRAGAQSATVETSVAAVVDLTR